MINLENISVSFDSPTGQPIQAVKDISLSIQDGEIFGVIGYSGAGKSTLVRTINLLQRPTKGKVIIDGTDITTLKPQALREERQKIGMIFQHFNLLKQRTVAGNVAFPLKYSGLSKKEIDQRVDELLDLVDLKERKNAYPSQLSGGQQQRVAIARALASEPKILLCDEATSALDPKTTASILKLLQELNQKLKLTIVIITHEMTVVKQICDRVAVLENGKKIEEGTVLDIFKDPQADLTKDFIKSASPIEAGIEDILTRPNLVNIQKDHRVVRIDFTGSSTGEPLISRLAREVNVQSNILYANVEILQNTPIGTILVALEGKPEDMDKAFDILKEEKVGIEDFTEVALKHLNEGGK